MQTPLLFRNQPVLVDFSSDGVESYPRVKVPAFVQENGNQIPQAT